MIWVVVSLCVFTSFVFAGLEAGLMSVSRVRLRHYARQRARAAILLEKMLEQPGRALVTILVVTNLLNIFATVMFTREMVSVFGHTGYVLAFLIGLPIYLFGLQLLPKALFRRFPYRALASFARVLWVAERLLSPLVAAGAAVAALIVPVKNRERRKAFLGREEVKYFMAESERVGTLSEVERAMIHNVVDFRAVKALDVMVPIESVHAMADSAPVEELFRVCRQHHLDRVPVLAKDGRITGLVQVFDVLMERRPAGREVGAFQRRIVSTTHDETAYAVIRKLRASRTGCAAVLDGAGRPLGIVNSADLIRRLVSVAIPSGS